MEDVFHKNTILIIGNLAKLHNKPIKVKLEYESR